jgi:hypothetical protein
MDKIILGDPLVRYPHPDNASILARLMHRAGKPAKGKRRTNLFIDEYTLHTHPDLIERFDDACVGLPAIYKSAAYGYPILVTRSGLIAGYAGGMSVVALRLPEALRDNDLKNTFQLERNDLGWICLDAWKPGAVERLPELIVAAIEYVGTEKVSTVSRADHDWQAAWKSMPAG